MEELKEFVKQHSAIVAAVIGGTCAIVAAIIRRERSNRQPHETKPILKLVLLSLLSIVLGGALLGAEFKVLPADPEKTLSLDNPGAIIMLAGWIFVAVGVVWGPINLIRLRTARQKGKELASAPVTAGGQPPPAPLAHPPPAKRGP